MRFLVAGDEMKRRSFSLSELLFPEMLQISYSWQNVCHHRTLSHWLLCACSRHMEGPWKAGSWGLWLQDCGPLPYLSPVYHIVNLGPILRIGGSRGFCMCVHACFHKRKKRGVVSYVRINGKCEGEGRENEKL